MIHKVFAIYDSAAKAYLPPFHLPTQKMAIRAFQDCLNSATHQFGAHPADYTLFLIASFDDAKGEYHPHSPHLNLGNGVALKGQESELPETAVKAHALQEVK